jgi:hypothetical protein
MFVANNNTSNAAVRFFGSKAKKFDENKEECSMAMEIAFAEMGLQSPPDGREIPTKKKKKPKGSGKVKKVIPPLKSIEEELAIIEERVAKMERERLGRKRGRHSVKEIVRAEKINKKATTAMGKLFGNEWLYSRHALRNGYRHINDMPKVALAESLLGKGTKVKISLQDVKLILKEQFRHGTSAMLNRYQHLHEEQETESKQIQINRQRNMARRREMEEAGMDGDQIIKEEQARRRLARDLDQKQKKAEAIARRQAKVLANQDATGTETTTTPAATTVSSDL